MSQPNRGRFRQNSHNEHFQGGPQRDHSPRRYHSQRHSLSPQRNERSLPYKEENNRYSNRNHHLEVSRESHRDRVGDEPHQIRPRPSMSDLSRKHSGSDTPHRDRVRDRDRNYDHDEETLQYRPETGRREINTRPDHELPRYRSDSDRPRTNSPPSDHFDSERNLHRRPSMDHRLHINVRPHDIVRDARDKKFHRPSETGAVGESARHDRYPRSEHTTPSKMHVESQHHPHGLHHETSDRKYIDARESFDGVQSKSISSVRRQSLHSMSLSPPRSRSRSPSGSSPPPRTFRDSARDFPVRDARDPRDIPGHHGKGQEVSRATPSKEHGYRREDPDSEPKHKRNSISNLDRESSMDRERTDRDRNTPSTDFVQRPKQQGRPSESFENFSSFHFSDQMPARSDTNRPDRHHEHPRNSVDLRRNLSIDRVDRNDRPHPVAHDRNQDREIVGVDGFVTSSPSNSSALASSRRKSERFDERREHHNERFDDRIDRTPRLDPMRERRPQDGHDVRHLDFSHRQNLHHQQQQHQYDPRTETDRTHRIVSVIPSDPSDKSNSDMSVDFDMLSDEARQSLAQKSSAAAKRPLSRPSSFSHGPPVHHDGIDSNGVYPHGPRHSLSSHDELPSRQSSSSSSMLKSPFRTTHINANTASDRHLEREHLERAHSGTSFNDHSGSRSYPHKRPEEMMHIDPSGSDTPINFPDRFSPRPKSSTRFSRADSSGPGLGLLNHEKHDPASQGLPEKLKFHGQDGLFRTFTPVKAPPMNIPPQYDHGHAHGDAPPGCDQPLSHGLAVVDLESLFRVTSTLRSVLSLSKPPTPMSFASLFTIVFQLLRSISSLVPYLRPRFPPSRHSFPCENPDRPPTFDELLTAADLFQQAIKQRANLPMYQPDLDDMGHPKKLDLSQRLVNEEVERAQKILSAQYLHPILRWYHHPEIPGAARDLVSHWIAFLLPQAYPSIVAAMESKTAVALSLRAVNFSKVSGRLEDTMSDVDRDALLSFQTGTSSLSRLQTGILKQRLMTTLRQGIFLPSTSKYPHSHPLWAIFDVEVEHEQYISASSLFSLTNDPPLRSNVRMDDQDKEEKEKEKEKDKDTTSANTINLSSIDWYEADRFGFFSKQLTDMFQNHGSIGSSLGTTSGSLAELQSLHPTWLVGTDSLGLIQRVGTSESSVLPSEDSHNASGAQSAKQATNLYGIDSLFDSALLAQMTAPLFDVLDENSDSILHPTTLISISSHADGTSHPHSQVHSQSNSGTTSLPLHQYRELDPSFTSRSWTRSQLQQYFEDFSIKNANLHLRDHVENAGLNILELDTLDSISGLTSIPSGITMTTPIGMSNSDTKSVDSYLKSFL